MCLPARASPAERRRTASPRPAAPLRPAPPDPGAASWRSTSASCQTRPLDPDDRRRARHASSARVAGVPRRRDRRGRLPRLPPEQRHLRPAPGRPQPDGAGEGPLRHASRPSSSRCSAYIAETYSRGWGHLTTRQNVQFHFVELEQTPEVLRLLASVGLTTPRGVRRHRAQRHGLPPRRRVPATRSSTSRPWAEARVPALPAPPARAAPAPQVQDQLLGLRDRLRPGDVQRRRRRSPSTRTLDDGTIEPGFRVFVAGGLGANPHPALALEEFTAREDLLPTIEAILRVFDHYGNRDNKLRARMKWLVDTMGIDELQRADPQGAQVPARVVDAGRAASPTVVQKQGDAPAGVARQRRPDADRPGHAGRRSAARRPTSAGSRPTSCAASPRAPCRPYAYARLGDITTDQFRAPRRRSSATSRSTSASPTARTSCSAASPRTSCRGLYDRLDDDRHGRARRRARPRRRRLPRRRHLQPRRHAVPRPRRRHRRRARGGRPRRGRRRPHQHLRLHQLAAASTTSPTSASSAPSAAPTASRRPATRCCSAATSAREQIALRREGLASCRPRPRPRPSCGSSAGSPTSARPARRSARGSTAPAAPRPSATTLKDLDEFPTPDEAPEFYVDYDETGPYVAEIGEAECAT